jgi:two-component system response regulator RegA
VLLVDDDEVFRRVLARSLERRGLGVLAAANGAEACALVTAEQPDFCVLDLKLAQESGLQLLPRLLALHPAMRVVVLTGYASIATAVEAVKQGAVNYLGKPATVDEILQALGGEAMPGAASVEEAVPMSVDRLEWEHIQKVLGENEGNISATARDLGMHRRTLQRKLQKRPARR